MRILSLSIFSTALSCTFILERGDLITSATNTVTSTKETVPPVADGVLADAAFWLSRSPGIQSHRKDSVYQNLKQKIFTGTYCDVIYTFVIRSFNPSFDIVQALSTLNTDYDLNDKTAFNVCISAQKFIYAAISSDIRDFAQSEISVISRVYNTFDTNNLEDGITRTGSDSVAWTKTNYGFATGGRRTLTRSGAGVTSPVTAVVTSVGVAAAATSTGRSDRGCVEGLLAVGVGAVMVLL